LTRRKSGRRHSPPRDDIICVRQPLVAAPPMPEVFESRAALIGAGAAAMVRRPMPARRWAHPKRALGRSQVVRQRILIPPFPGSNPGAPANQSDLCRPFPTCAEKPQFRPRCAVCCGLRGRKAKVVRRQTSNSRRWSPVANFQYPNFFGGDSVRERGDRFGVTLRLVGRN
jgi:hypothetical protein